MANALTRAEVAKDRRLRRLYGITLHDFTTMLRRQRGLCAVCQRPMRVPNVDHEHPTRQQRKEKRPIRVRGLLCSWCNHYVIGRHKDWRVLLRASNYLKKAEKKNV